MTQSINSPQEAAEKCTQPAAKRQELCLDQKRPAQKPLLGLLGRHRLEHQANRETAPKEAAENARRRDMVKWPTLPKVWLPTATNF